MSSFPSGFAPPPAAAPELEHYFAQIAAQIKSALVDIGATGDASFDADVSIVGDLAVGGDIDVNGNGDIQGDLTLSGGTSSLIFSNLSINEEFIQWGSNGQLTRITNQGGLGISCDSSMLIYTGDFALSTILGDLSVDATTTSETLYLLSDSGIQIRTNRQNGFATSHLWSFSSDGSLSAPGDISVAGDIDLTGTVGVSGGTITIQHASSAAVINLDAVDGAQRNINFRDETTGNLRWVLKNDTNDDFALLARADDGSAVGTALAIDRQTMDATFGADLTVTTGLAVGGDLDLTGSLDVSGALTATASGNVDINNSLTVGNRLTIDLDGGVTTDLESTGFHEAFWIGRNLRYDGSGDPATNATYVEAAGVNNQVGLAYFMRGNGGDDGWYVDWYSAPVSTGAGNAATLTTRMHLHHEGLTLGGAAGEDQILRLNATADSDSGGDAALILNGDAGNTTGEPGGAYTQFLLDNASVAGEIGLTQGAFWPSRVNNVSGVGINDLVIAADTAINLVRDTTLMMRFTSSGIGIHNVDLDLNGNSITNVLVDNFASGSSPSLMGWVHDMVFTASDHNTVAWTSGTITLQNSDTFSITAGNTGTMSAITYIYLDADTSTTVLQTSTTASDAVGAQKILIAVAEDVDSGKDAVFQIFGGSSLHGLFTADNIAAGTITTDELTANIVNGTDLNVVTLDVLTADMGTLTAGKIAVGGITISATDEQILFGAATAPFTGKGIFIGKDGSDYEFRAGDPSGEYIFFDGTEFDVNVEHFSAPEITIDGTLSVLGTGNIPRFVVEPQGDGTKITFAYYSSGPTLPSSNSAVWLEHDSYGITSFYSTAAITQTGGGGDDSGDVELLRFDLSDEPNPAITMFAPLQIASEDAAILTLNGDISNTTGEPGGAFVRFQIDGGATEAEVGLTQSAKWPSEGHSISGISANDLVIASETAISLASDTAVFARFTDSGITTPTGNLVPIITHEETFDFGSVAAGSSLGHLFTFTGLETTDAIFLAYDGISAGERDLLFTITVSTADSANLRVYNPTSSPINPGSINFRCVAFKL